MKGGEVIEQRSAPSHSAPTSSEVLKQTCFITGANSNYFWLANTAIQSLQEQAPEIDIRVMDFGFTAEQARFLGDQGLLLPRPSEIPKNLHPYTLKTCFGLYARPLPHQNFVWIDSDMLCLMSPSSLIADLLTNMINTGKKVAACQDKGPNPTLEEFARNFRAPALSQFVTANRAVATQPYLNTGFTVFAGATEFLAKWPRLTAKIQGEVCIDQNAFNILFHANPVDGLILDARRWNVHSGLLADLKTDQQPLVCYGEKIVLLHCTSHKNLYHDEMPVNLKIAGATIPARYKTFRDEALRRIHLATLERFLKANAVQLKSAGVVSP